MPYAVIWLNGEKVIGSTPFADFTTAKEHAEAHLPIKARQTGATEVEVRDDEGKVRFRRPRTLHGGQN